MPVIKSAIKKLRKDRKREKENNVLRKNFDDMVKKAKKQKTPASVAKAISTVDKAVKKNLLHKNKASRIKSALTKLARPSSPARKEKSVSKTRAGKTASKPKKTAKRSAKSKA